MELSELVNNLYFNIVLLAISFAILLKAADYFVESAAGLALYFDLPKMLVGILVVAFGTTAPEISVSAQSSLMGEPEFAFGNAIGSVIVDDGVGMALAALISPVVISIEKNLLRSVALFIIAIDTLAYILSLNGVIGRLEGMVFMAILSSYLFYMVYSEKKRKSSLAFYDEEIIQAAEKQKGSLLKIILMLTGGLAGVIIASRLIIYSAKFIAVYFQVPKAVIGLTVIAIGTSLPEISTCIIASAKGHGEIAVGDILGADILNILWIIGLSAAVNPIHIDIFTVHFSFISMLVIVLTMLGVMLLKYRLPRWSGALLLALYAAYAFLNYRFYHM
ncbi:MAG: calcium/sodium antiporter [Spirochaetota bacterium]